MLQLQNSILKLQKMSKDFFSVIAQQLCSIKNSPFSMFSAGYNYQIDGIGGESHIKKSTKLSQNPDRLFNTDKYKQQNKHDPQFIEFEKQQKQNLQKIQITLLKQKTQQQLRKLQEKKHNLKDQTFTHPYSLFKVDRSVCMSCNKCFQYNGNFNIGCQIKHDDSQQSIQYLCCLTCACPMNSHSIVPYSNKFSSQIYKYLTQKVIQTDQINYKYFPLCFVKDKQTSYQVLINNFLNYLPQLGFQIISNKTYTRKQFQMFQIKRQILTGIDKQTVQKLMVFVSFLEKQHFNWQEKIPQQVDQSLFQIVKKLKDNIKVSQYLSKSDQVLIFYVKNINYFDPNQMTNILAHYSSIFQSSFLWMPRQTKQMFLSSCLIFPEHFILNHQIFVLPSQKTQLQAQKINSRFKDLLDYNNYTIIGQINKIQREKLESILKFQNFNKLNYIMGQQQLNPVLKRIRIQLSAKVGPSIFTIPFRNAVDFIEISSSDKKSPFMMAFPQYLRSQRCMIILSPCFTLANFDQIVMTLLRVNKFVLLKRRHVILNDQQARYLATLQKISEQNLEYYVKMMTSGVSQIVLVSKRGAIYESNILLNGSKFSLSDTKIKTLKQLPLIKFKRGTDSYEYTPTIKQHHIQKLESFSSINQLFKLESILFPQQNIETRFMTNQKNGQIIKMDFNQKKFKELKISSKMKENMLNEIKKDSFNYWAFSSKSQFLTQQLAGIFMPQTTLFQSCVVIVKPGFIHLIQKIKQALAQHRYHVIMQKTVMLSKVLASQMIINLQKVRTSKTQLKNYIEAYSNQKIHLFCVSKVYGKQQMFSILSQFSFLSTMSSVVTDYVDDDILREVLVPVWNNQQFVLKILSPPLYNVQQAINSLFTPNIKNQDKFQILRYLIGSYYGVNIQDLTLNSLIGKFSYYLTSNTVASLQSWFYSQLSKLNARYVPTLFQHREIGQLCLVIQSYTGYPFLNLITSQYDAENLKLKQSVNKQERKSLTLFLWGKQLAQFVHLVSENSPNLKGWGRIVKNNDQWQGQHSQKGMHQGQRQFLQECLQKFDDNQYDIHLNIKKLFQSRFLFQKFNQTSKRKLIPYFIEGKIQQCIRIIQTLQVSKLHLVDRYSMIDPQHQKNQQKSLYTLSLYNVEPSIGTKQELIVDIMVYLMKLQKQDPSNAEIYSLLMQYFIQDVLQFSQADQIQSELYLRLLKQYFALNQNWIKTKLKTYPNLKKFITSNTNNDQISGKKRKYLQKKQYYIDKHNILTEQQKQVKQKQYKNFNLNYEAQQQQYQKNNPLLNMDDPLHKKFALQQKNITLLRQNEKAKGQRTGIYVQFQKKITQNQQMLMTKIKGQVDKFNLNRQEKILYETGLQNQLWYRKTKGQKIQSKANKVQDAIKKQIGKFITFKRQSQKQKTQKDLYQTK